MATPPIPDDELRRTASLIEEALAKGYKPPGLPMARDEKGAIRTVSESTGLGERAVRNRAKQAEKNGYLDWGKYKPPQTVRVSIADQTPTERHDAAFWRRRAETLSKELDATAHALREVSGLMERPVNPSSWSLPSTGATKRRAAGLLTISDIHAGEVVRAAEVGGINAYDLDVCRARLRRLFAATIQILPRWASDCKLTGVFVALNGDLVSGDIHEELRETNAITAQRQVWFVADELAAGIAKLADAFGMVYVCVTPGNHGRSTHKTHAKGTADLSYDTMVGDAIRRHFALDKRVTVNVSPSRDATYEILGKRILQTHHDAGGGGGQGFAGPMLPILRKGKAVEYMSAQSRVFFDLILTAHYHSSGNLGKILANGSVVGWCEFAQSIRASPEVAQQWLCLITERWGIRERAEIKLQDAMK